MIGDMIMENNIMWVWWTATVLICAWKLGEGVLRPYRMLEWPFLACAMWAYFYCYMAYEAEKSLPEYLGNGITNIGQLMPLLCLIGVVCGWKFGTQTRGKGISELGGYPYFRFWLGGFAFLLIGAAGGLSVMHAAATGNLNYQETSGYWYLLFYVGYPGLAMSIWALLKMQPGYRKYLWAVTILGLVAFMFPHMIDARRGPLYPAIIVLLLVPPLATRRPPNPLLFCGALGAAALVMLLFLQVRTVTYNGGTWGEAIHHLDVNAAVEEKGKQAEDNEYINNCQLIGTIFQNGKYQYGTGHLSLLWHWIPRAVWKDKPTLGEGTYSFEEMFDDVEAATGFHLLGSGASSGGVADTFVQYGLLCPFFWFGISWLFGAVYMKALLGLSPLWLFSYVGFLCASHWLVSQGFAASFVPGMCFQAVPLVTFFLLGRAPKKVPVGARYRREPERPTVPEQVLQS
jgi:hypothetical protein